MNAVIALACVLGFALYVFLGVLAFTIIGIYDETTDVLVIIWPLVVFTILFCGMTRLSSIIINFAIRQLRRLAGG